MQVQREAAKLNDHQPHLPRNVREEAWQHVLRRRAVVRRVDQAMSGVRPRGIHQLEEADSEALVRPALAPWVLHYNLAIVRHATLARLVDAASVLSDRRANDTDGKR